MPDQSLINPPQRTAVRRDFGLSLALVFLLVLSLAFPIQAEQASPDTDGLWEYTGLVTGGGVSMPLTGVFLIKDGFFLQQSIFNDEPFAEAGSMAHSGPFWAGEAGSGLTSEQTLSLDPKADEVLRSLGVMQHKIDVMREGDQMTIVFSSGTKQTFDLLGNADDMRLFKFKDGALALADGYFVLVAGDEQRVVTGYGHYRENGPELSFQVIRWAESDGTEVINQRDIAISAELNAQALILEDGREFPIVH